MEQQRVIRKLLRKEGREIQGEEMKLEDNVESVSDTEEDTTLEISISVPNLSDITSDNNIQTDRPFVQRSISDTHVSELYYILANIIKLQIT